ncbi:hydroxyquinol 1,2-dioxygenase [Microbacterium sp. YMB-B2]|uniref:Hydroxyquinol 1,2-dioxygenase n=1 Tax=Microbacterium tenebrionis TaxID=2830665 RepID=A0A9X1S1A8_9MICO|nr:dioxygenase [Microbacterium tenebrionis]MCC2030060.1 hydroxyquinol 1,2-dioxygenase [Microbacterium tenebrionis]
MTPHTSDAVRQAARESALTDEVVHSFATSTDPRLRVVMASLVRHLHAFIRDVRLTQEEWDASIAFLTRAGDITDAHRQEFILLSDVLGASMMTVAVNAPARSTATESTVFGPFFVEDAPLITSGDDISAGMPGRPCHVRGSVRSTAGEVLAGARVEVWAADDDGFYDVQYEGSELAGRAHLFTDEEGKYDYWTVQPAAYPIPHDGPVGDLLTAAGRSPMRPAHIHFMVSHPGYETLITHIFVAGDEWLDSDAVFGVKESLIVPFTEHEPGHGPRGRVIEETWSSTTFDIVLAPAEPGPDA